MSYQDQLASVLDGAFRELTPLFEAAVRALDKPGTRALRRKLDGEFHFAVGIYGAHRRAGVSEDDWSSLDLPQYQRATPVWPADIGRKAKSAAQRAGDARAPIKGPQLVIDNTRSGRAPLGAPLVEGGAA